MPECSCVVGVDLANLLGQPVTLREGCPIHGLRAAEQRLDDARRRMREFDAEIRARFDHVFAARFPNPAAAVQDTDGVYQITSLTTQEHP
jgi:hypothetical protein